LYNSNTSLFWPINRAGISGRKKLKCSWNNKINIKSKTQIEPEGPIFALKTDLIKSGNSPD